MLMEKIGAKNEAVKQARDFKEPGFSFTRRTIALASIFSIVVLPLVAATLVPGLPVSYGFTESVGGFLFFTDSSSPLVWTTGTGIVITPIHSHLVYAIAGMYFGSSSVK
jgi:hypothetical protein